MRTPLLRVATRTAVASVLTWLALATPAAAQATIEPRALEQLGPAPAAPVERPAVKHAPPARREAARAEPRDPHAHPNGPHQSLPAMRGAPPDVATAKPVMPQVPLAPPPAPVLPPPLIVPTRPPPPPLPPTVSPTAIGDATKTADGMRVTFGAGAAALNPQTEAALKDLAKEAEAKPGTTLSVLAYAAETPDDPSTARRLSLSRALAVRSVLITSGIPSMRIYVKALGGVGPGAAAGPPDRVDIALATPAPPPQPAQSTPTPAASASTPAVSAPAPSSQKAAP